MVLAALGMYIACHWEYMKSWVFLNCCCISMNVSWEKYTFFIGDECRGDWHNALRLLDCDYERFGFLYHN